MNVLKLTDWNVQQLRRTHPAFKGTKFLARGSFCAVFEMPNAKKVLKLTTDRTHAQYLTDGLSPQGKYKPKVLATHDVEFQTSNGLSLYLFEVERLEKLQAGSPAKKQAMQLMRYFQKHKRFPEELSDLAGMTRSFVKFLRSLNWFVDNYDVRTDLKTDNFMQRADGSLVLSDPVYDYALYQKTWRNATVPY